MDFTKSLMIAASGLKVQTGRIRVIAENLANADSTGKTPGSDPYRRKIATVDNKFDKMLGEKVVEMGKTAEDQSDFQLKYEPGHPAANQQGYVKYPNVNSLIEAVDIRDAQRSYEANLNVITSTRQMISKTLDILRG